MSGRLTRSRSSGAVGDEKGQESVKDAAPPSPSKAQAAKASEKPADDHMDISPRKSQTLKRAHDDSGAGEKETESERAPSKRARQGDEAAANAADNNTNTNDRSKSTLLRSWESDTKQRIEVRIGDITLEDVGTNTLFPFFLFLE